MDHVARQVVSPEESQQAFDLAARLAGDTKVFNGISVRGRDQVMLKVTVAEVQRDLIKQLGINLNASFNIGATAIDFVMSNPSRPLGQALTRQPPYRNQWRHQCNHCAPWSAPALSVLWPNRTSRRSPAKPRPSLPAANFPIPAGLSCDTTRSPPVCQQQIEYKKFGVELNFRPVVLSEGRISLKVMTEVSDFPPTTR